MTLQDEVALLEKLIESAEVRGHKDRVEVYRDMLEDTQDRLLAERKKLNNIPYAKRVMVTVFYSDGSSDLYDFKDPKKFEFVRSRDKGQSEQTPFDEETVFSLRCVVSDNIPTVISSYPVRS